MPFCHNCGGELVSGTPPGDDRERDHCLQCGYVHYVNPRILVSCIVHNDDKILWIKRGLEPQKNLWAMPAGFMEVGESLQQAAVRELDEETGLQIPAGQLELAVLSSLVFIDEVYVVFQVYHEEVSLVPIPPETLDVGFLAESEAPWGELAYPFIEDYMRECYSRLRQGDKTILLGEFSREKQQLVKV
jgi:ADP-ribose pyrophosphatase YjhB (NUDIX family)